MRIKGKRGFTLVELMVVVIIVGILAASAVPIYRANIRRAYSAEGFATLGAIRGALRLYKAEHGTYRLAGTLPIARVTEVLGLDVGHNHYWDHAAFELTEATEDAFLATATGADSTAPGADRIAGITLTMNHLGEITGP